MTPPVPEDSSHAGFYLGDVWFEPALDRLTRAGAVDHLEPKLTELLLCLANRQGHVVAKTEILDAVWPNQFVSESTLTRAIAELRRLLGDEAQTPRFIETIPRRGYRLIVALERAKCAGPPPLEESRGGGAPESRGMVRAICGLPTRLALLGTLLALAVVAGAALLRWSLRGESLPSLAVLPITNLTGDPANDDLIDSLTDALIAELVRDGSVRVASRTSSMAFKRSRKTVPQIASQLGVSFALEGSVALDGNRFVIRTSLIDARSDRGMWAASFEPSSGDFLASRVGVSLPIARQVGLRLAPNEAVDRIDPEASSGPTAGVAEDAER